MSFAGIFTAQSQVLDVNTSHRCCGRTAHGTDSDGLPMSVRVVKCVSDSGTDAQSSNDAYEEACAQAGYVARNKVLALTEE